MLRWSGVLLATAASLAGCAKTDGATPEQICSAPGTYDQIIGLIAAQVGQASAATLSNDVVRAASSTSALRRVLSFALPTVDGVNKDTHKTSCKAMMQVNLPSALQSALDLSGLQVNEVTSGHVQVAIAYAVQPSADEGKQILSLEQATELATVALQASIAATMRLRNASGTAPRVADATPVEPSPQPEDTADQQMQVPDEPAVDTSTNVDRARQFAQQFFERTGQDADSSLPWLSSHYGAQVEYFGKQKDRNSILADKAAYIRRWPERTYSVEPDSLRATCGSDGKICRVSGIVDYTAASADRGASAQGKAAFDLGTYMAGDDPIVVSESSRVIDRQ